MRRRPRPAPGWRGSRLAFAVALVVCLGTAAMTAADAVTARDLYERAVAADTSVRARLDDANTPGPVLLRAIRSAVDAYWQVVYRFPRSGYCDNALWQGAQLSIEAFTRFGEERDRQKALSHLKALVSEYPSSSLVARARSERVRVERLRFAPPAASAVLISNITRQQVADGVEIAIELDGPVTYTEERLEGPARVFFDLANTRTTDALREAVLRFDGELIRQVRVGHHPDNVTRVVLDLEGAHSYQARLETEPPRLVVLCRTGDRPAAAVAPATGQATPPPPRPAAAPSLPPAGVPEAPASNLKGGFSIARQLGLGVNRIVIDAGHGGHDTGALGSSTTEAKVTLDIALRLERLLAKEPGVEAVLTRRTDVFIPLQERSEIASREPADLFVSIHVNASRNRNATGVETYLLNFATSPDAAEVAARENSSSELTMSRLDDLVKKIALSNKVNESRDLAGYVQSSLVKRLRPANKGLRDRGVKQAPFVVLVGTSMPSVLVEVSFISNRQEGRLLATPAYRQRVAEGILDGIRRYQSSLKKVKIAQGSTPGEPDVAK